MQYKKLRNIIKKILKENEEVLYQGSSELNLYSAEDVEMKRREYYDKYFLYLKDLVAQDPMLKDEIISQEMERQKASLDILKKKKLHKIGTGGFTSKKEPSSLTRQREIAQEEIKRINQREADLIGELINKLSSL